MASISVTVLSLVTTSHLIAFVLAIGAERNRSTAEVVPDIYDEKTYCSYVSDSSTSYGLSAFGLVLISHTLVNCITKCFCFGKGLDTSNTLRTCTIFFFILSWVSFLAVEACLLAGSAKNAYHTKYREMIGEHLSCATLRKGVFIAGAFLCLESMVASIVYYLLHCRATTGGWQKHQK